MKFILSNKLITKYFFIFIWTFFFLRTSAYIDIEKNIIQFNSKYWYHLYLDIISIFIFVTLIIYKLYFILTNKNISSSLVLILYPIMGVMSYFANIELYDYNFYIWHHFITLSSLVIFITIINSYKIFDFDFLVILFKILIALVLIYFFFKIIPLAIFKIYNNLNLRLTYQENFNFFDIADISLIQNINGQSRVLFIVQLFFLILFKKNFHQKRFISNFYFCISLLSFLIILIYQSRFVIVVSCLFTFLILVYNDILTFKNKITYLLIIISVVLLSTKFYENSRFSISNYNSILNQNNSNFFIADSLDENKIEKFKVDEKYSLKNCNINTYFNFADIYLSGRLCGWEILVKNLNKGFFGKGFFADQILLKPIQKTSSNSWINILFNTGLLSFVVILMYVLIVFFKYFRIKNINNKNFYISYSYYLVFFILLRSLIEDTIAFLNLDLLILTICLLIVTNSNKKKSFTLKKKFSSSQKCY